MKRFILVFMLIFSLASCKSEEPGFIYDESDFVYEINQQNVDYLQHIYTTHTLLIDDEDVDFTKVGEYVLYVIDAETEIHYEIPVVIEDTISPEIMVPDEFPQYYQVDSEIDISLICMVDNSLGEITYITNMEEIDMSTSGDYSLVITAQDETGNLRVVTLPISVRMIIYPDIDINVFNISDSSFTVQFIEDDPSGYKVESSYSVSKNGDVISEGILGSGNTLDISELNQATEYRVVLYYVFLIPGEDQKVMSKSVFVTTEELFRPIVELEDVFINLESMSFTVGVIDPDELLDNVRITITDEEDMIILDRVTGDDPHFTLTELDLYEEYTVTVTYSYDFADGNGVQEYTDVYTYQIIQ